MNLQIFYQKIWTRKSKKTIFTYVRNDSYRFYLQTSQILNANKFLTTEKVERKWLEKTSKALTGMYKVSYAILDLFTDVPRRLHSRHTHWYVFRRAPSHHHLKQ